MGPSSSSVDAARPAAEPCRHDDGRKISGSCRSRKRRAGRAGCVEICLGSSFALAALDAQLGQGASQRGVDGGDFFGGEFFLQASLGALPGFFGLGFVNLVGLDCQIGEDRDAGGA